MSQVPPEEEVGAEPEAVVAAPHYIGTPKAERMRGSGGGAGGGDVSVIEGRVMYLEQRMAAVDDKLDKIIEKLAKIPEAVDIRNYLLLALALFVAVATMLIGGMGWLETRAARVQPMQQGSVSSPPQPIIIQVPLPSQPKK